MQARFKCHSISEGNIGAAAVDIGGMAQDLGAIALPSVPGGFGFGIQGPKGCRHYPGDGPRHKTGRG